ncbi:MAG TPA: PaaI family thioesterase [Polyangiales bacterium]|nr:PaaI family thioesterase [Polyangiales bacterium]
MTNPPRDPQRLKAKLLDFAKDFAFFKLIGFEVLDCEPGWSKCQIVLRPELHNPNGVLHGGVLATLIDAGITQAMLMTDEYQVIRDTKGAMSTVDLHVKYLRPISAGLAICESRIVHLGKRIVHAQCKVQSAEGKDLALGDASMILVPGSG